MTPKQLRFVEEYLIDLNATQAAVRAGYAEKTAHVTGPRLLANVRVADAIAKCQKTRSQRTQITADAVVAELAKLGFSNMLDYVTVQSDGLAYIDLSKLTREQAAAIQEMTVDEYVEGAGEDARPVKKVKIKLADKKSSLELLGKHLGIFDSKQDALHTVDVRIRIGDVELTNDRTGD